ncbi:MAG: cysteine--tRNA ligase [Candidatus Enteromonas sp.]|nr:cysteine--tRNA ligase [bacterium]MDD6917695.1 cysteine--tRNA ligase [bacterium]MDY6100874.1 cysteine--tRNA ligase [Candidatus Enteromonas sp.]
MHSVKLFNSLGNKIEEFTPLVPGKVSIYVCGPTVYNSPHIGNMRPVIVFDTWRRLFLSLGYEVTYVSNYTDVDDKIINRAKELGISEKELTEGVIEEFRSAVSAVGALQPDVTPRPTVYMPQMISYIQDLVDSGNAYEKDGDVYFRVGKDKDYGCLSGNTPDSLMSGARIEVSSKKESPLDFALWKKTEEGIKWDTPWSKGRPGWHTECCVMIDSIFKAQNGYIDIHGGGFDLKFPHHENEIAQSEAHNGNHLAHYWLHNGFINIDNEKMSKSLGNVILAKDVIAKFGGMPFRLMVLNTHYRAPLSFTEETIGEAMKTYQKIVSCYRSLSIKLQRDGVDLSGVHGEGEDAFFDELCNDLNTPNALSVLFAEVKQTNQDLRQHAGEAELLKAHYGRLKDYLFALGIDGGEVLLDEEALDLYREYEDAKKAKDFQKSDLVRAKLMEKGVF